MYEQYWLDDRRTELLRYGRDCSMQGNRADETDNGANSTGTNETLSCTSLGRILLSPSAYGNVQLHLPAG